MKERHLDVSASVGHKEDDHKALRGSVSCPVHGGILHSGCICTGDSRRACDHDTGTGYTAEKITHAGKGVMTADGIVDYTGNGTLGVNLEDGEGDRGQNYSWGSIGYGDRMYIGTCYGAWMSTLQFMKFSLGRQFDDAVMKEALDTYYHEHMYTAEEDGVDALGILLKLNVKTGEVKILMSKELTGQNTIFRNAVEFKDKLYFCGAVNTIHHLSGGSKTDECKQVYAGMTLEEYMAAYQKGVSVGIRGCACMRTGRS